MAAARPDPAEFTVALYRYLARTPAALLGVSLADAVGERRPQNLPGTTTQYPNWCVPLADGDGRPVLLEDLPSPPGRARRRGRGQPAWRSRSWQRSARSRPSRPSMSRRRSAAGGLVLAIRSSVASITERLSATG